jgi:hypothetical protein
VGQCELGTKYGARSLVRVTGKEKLVLVVPSKNIYPFLNILDEGFHDLTTEKLSFLFILFGWNSVCVT